jgi:hypothetical protein
VKSLRGSFAGIKEPLGGKKEGTNEHLQILGLQPRNKKEGKEGNVCDKYAPKTAEERGRSQNV